MNPLDDNNDNNELGATTAPLLTALPWRLVVTRPQPDADRWCRQLREWGCEAEALPLMEIGPVPEALQLQALIDSAPDFDAVMWVSTHAVTRFFARYHGRWPGRTRCWAPGPGTAAALLEAGVPADLIDAPPEDADQYDSETLWPVIAQQLRPGLRILLVRGRSEGVAETAPTQGNGREVWVQRWREAGAQVEVMALYQRRCAAWHAETRALAEQLRAPDTVWLFSSSEAVGHLPQLMPGVNWRDQAALATHDRIAQALQAQGFTQITLCRPTPQDVANTLLSLAQPL